MSIEMQADRALIRRSARSVRYLLVTIDAPTAPTRMKRPTVNLSFVIDRSGSMGGGKLTRACEAVMHALGRLNPDDHFNVVAYDHEVTVVTAPAQADAAARDLAREGILALQPRGATNLSDGWLKGCELIASELDEESIARCLLLTDGLANRGIVDQNELADHASALRQRGITTSTFGVGADFDEHLLGTMADRGGGTFHFLSDAEAIPRAIDQELGEALEVVARDAALVVDAPGVEVSSLNGFPTRVEHGCTRIELGGLISGQVLHAIVKLRFPTGEAGEQRKVTVSAVDRAGALTQTRVEQGFTHARGADVDAQPRRREVDRAVASVHAARARREALAMNRDGAYEDAGRLLARCRDRIATYAGEDTELRRLMEELDRRRDELSRPTESMYRKGQFTSSMNSMKSRSSNSASMRRIQSKGVTCLSMTAAQYQALEIATTKLMAPLAALHMRVKHRALVSDGLLLASPLSHEQESALVQRARGQRQQDGLCLIFTEHALRDQWFSHLHPSFGAAVISTSPAQQSNDANLAAFGAYELLLHSLQLVSPRYDMLALLHEDERGCLFDLCRDHRRLAYKLDAMGLCPSCRTQLDTCGIDSAAVDAASAIVASLQREACPA